MSGREQAIAVIDMGAAEVTLVGLPHSTDRDHHEKICSICRKDVELVAAVRRQLDDMRPDWAADPRVEARR